MDEHKDLLRRLNYLAQAKIGDLTIADEAADAIERIAKERDEARAENESLREALAPFAEEGERWGDFSPDSDCVFERTSNERGLHLGLDPRASFTVGDFRRARAAMHPSGAIPAAKPDQEAGAIPSGKTEEADARD